MLYPRVVARAFRHALLAGARRAGATANRTGPHQAIVSKRAAFFPAAGRMRQAIRGPARPQTVESAGALPVTTLLTRLNSRWPTT